MIMYQQVRANETPISKDVPLYFAFVPQKSPRSWRRTQYTPQSCTDGRSRVGAEEVAHPSAALRYRGSVPRGRRGGHFTSLTCNKGIERAVPAVRIGRRRGRNDLLFSGA
jgi:hypothetical protein